jgi:hypothetical protein
MSKRIRARFFLYAVKTGNNRAQATPHIAPLSAAKHMNACNYLAGSLSGPKSPIFRHTSQFFLTVALLRPAKNRFVWQKMEPFLSQTRPAK